MSRAAGDGLRRAPLLAGLSDRDRDEIVGHASVRGVAAGHTLFHEGDPAAALHLVEAGRLKLTQVTPAGEQVIVRFVAPGEACAAIAALDGRAYPFSAVAVEPSRIRSWPRHRLAELMRRWPRLEANVLSVAGEHARAALDRFRELATEPVASRIGRALLRLARPAAEGRAALVEHVTQREIAEMAATTPFTVSRTLAEWETQGILEVRRGRIRIRSVDRLAQAAAIEESGGTD